MRTSLACSLLAIAVAAACGGKKDKDAPPAEGFGSAPAPPAGSVVIFVNGEPVATVTKEQVTAWPRVDALVPEASRRLGTWATVQLPGARPAAAELSSPSASHPDKVPVLFPGEGGAAAFGMFDPVELAKRGAPGFREDGVREVRITLSKEERGGDHQGGTGEGADPSKLVIRVKKPDGASMLTGDQIIALPREAQPGQEDTKGWRLTQLLEAAGVTTFERVTLIDDKGQTLPLERKDYDDKTVVPFIKLNKQGSLRFRVLKQAGDGWQAGADLRSIATIEIQ